LVEQSWKKGDPDPKALGSSGVLWQEGTPEEPRREQMWLRFVSERPMSAITTKLPSLVLPGFAQARQNSLTFDLG
jgi:hypothetical protein